MWIKSDQMEHGDLSVACNGPVATHEDVPMSLYSEMLKDLREAANPQQDKHSIVSIFQRSQVHQDNLHLNTASARFWGCTSILVQFIII